MDNGEPTPLRLQRFQGTHTMYTISIDLKGGKAFHWPLIQQPVLLTWQRWAQSRIS
jgi:hypothetical protein